MIHPTAIIDPSCELASDVSVGAYSIVGPNVRIDAGTEIGPHVVIKGPTRIGKDNRIFQFASVGKIHKTRNIVVRSPISTSAIATSFASTPRFTAAPSRIKALHELETITC